MSSKANQLVKEIFHKGMMVDQTDGTDFELVIQEFTNKVVNLAREEAIGLADGLIGKDILVHYDRSDLMEDEPGLRQDQLAVLKFQAKQRLLLAKYQNPQLEMSQIHPRVISEYRMPSDDASEMEA